MVPLLCKLTAEECAEIGVKCLTATQHAPAQGDWSEGPAVIDLKDWAAFKEWQEVEKVKFTCCNFGGRYHQDKVVKKDLRGQMPVLSKEGKEESESLFENFMHDMRLPISPIRDCKALKNACHVLWIWGNVQQSTHVGLTRNCLPQLRSLSEGQLSVVLVEMRTFLHAIDYRREGTPQEDQLKEYFMSQSMEQLKVLVEKGARLYHFVMEPASIMYVPVGYCVIEHTSGGPVVYGLRKTINHPQPMVLQHMAEYLKDGADGEKAAARVEEIAKAWSRAPA